MFKHHRNVTPRTARMLRELGGQKTAQGGAADVAVLGDHLRKATLERWFKAAAALIAALWPSLRGTGLLMPAGSCQTLSRGLATAISKTALVRIDDRNGALTDSVSRLASRLFPRSLAREPVGRQ